MLPAGSGRSPAPPGGDRQCLGGGSAGGRVRRSGVPCGGVGPERARAGACPPGCAAGAGGLPPAGGPTGPGMPRRNPDNRARRRRRAAPAGLPAAARSGRRPPPHGEAVQDRRLPAGPHGRAAAAPSPQRRLSRPAAAGLLAGCRRKLPRSRESCTVTACPSGTDREAAAGAAAGVLPAAGPGGFPGGRGPARSGPGP